MKRREFIPRMAGGSAIVAALPVLLSSCEEDDPVTPDNNNNNDDDGDNGDDGITVDLNDSNFVALKNEGGFAYTGSIIVINTGGGNFAALSSVCTHTGCTVNYSQSGNNLPCPCHGSVFTLQGTVVQGPASSDLQTYTVTREGDLLTIT